MSSRIASVDQRWARNPFIECHYCGVWLTRQTATREHLRPKSKGGKDDPRNVVFACRPCNSARGNSDYETFKESMLPVKRQRRGQRNSGGTA